MATRYLRLMAGLTVAFVSLSAQYQPTSPPNRKIIWGTVGSVWDNRVYVNRETRVETVGVDSHTEIWKGKISHDLSVVEPGDRIFATCHLDASGKLVAESIQLNAFHTTGADITAVSATGFSIFTNPNADPHSGYTKESRIIEVDADTFFEDSAREDLKPGRGADITGLELADGKIVATRITVSEGNHAVRFKGSRIVMPNGDIRSILPNGQVVGPVLGHAAETRGTSAQ